MKRETAMLCSLAVTGALTAVGAGQWSDDFEAYDLGPLAGQGGWAGWDNDPGAENFIVVDDPTFGGMRALEIDGVDDAVQEFGAGTYSSGLWKFSAWVYFPSTNTDGQYFIILNQYAAGDPNNRDWAQQLLMDGSSGTVSSSELGGEVPLVVDDWAQIEVWIDLDNDTQWVCYNGTFVGTGPWVSGGPVEIQALDLWGASAAAIYYDNIVLEPAAGYPVGACCFLDGTCQELTPEDCDAAGGLFQQYCMTCAEADCPAPPDNDDCVNAEAIGDVNGKGWDTRLATADGPGGCNFGAVNVWYCWTPSETGTATVEVFDTSFDDPDASASLAIYSVCGCPDGPPDIYCQNDGSEPFVQFEVPVARGVTYLIEVGSDEAGAGGGTGKLSAYVGDPPPPFGACCVGGACVENTDQLACEAQDGFWYSGQECPDLECPCAITPPSQVDEFEDELCGENTNGGCNSDPAVFETILCGTTVQGTATLVDDGMGNIVRDTDWYRITVAEPTTLTLTVEAQFDVTFGLSQYQRGLEGSGNCADTTGFISPAVVDGNDCETHVLTDVALPIAGDYFIFVAPDFSEPELFDCSVPRHYNLTVECEVGPIPGACCLDGNCIETGSLADCLASGGEWFLGRDCADFDCPLTECPPADHEIFQHNDDELGGGVSCVGGGIGSDNGWARSFPPEEIPGEGEPFFVQCVEFAVSSYSGNADWPVTLNIYEDTDGGEPQAPGTDLVLIASKEFLIVQGATNEIFAAVLDTPAQIPAGGTMVVEVFSEEMDPVQGAMYPGCNIGGGASGETYLRSAGCGLNTYTTYTAIGFGDRHLLMWVSGSNVGPECPEDLDGNDVVNVFDLLQLLGAWGPCPGCPEDLDGNDVVNVFDLLQLLGAWGPC